MKVKLLFGVKDFILIIIFTIIAIHDVRIKLKSGKKLLSINTRSRLVLMTISIFFPLVEIVDLIYIMFFNIHNGVFELRISIYVLYFVLLFTVINTPSLTERGIWLRSEFIEWIVIDKVVWEKAAGKYQKLTLIKKKIEKANNVIRINIPQKYTCKINSVFSERQVKFQNEKLTK